MGDITYWAARALSGLPGIFGLRTEEGPKYEVRRAEGSIEVREYAPRPRNIATTAPVAVDLTGEAMLMRFVMPSKITASTAPQPNDPAVTLREVPAETLAALRCSGRGLPRDAAARERELGEWLEMAGYDATGPARVAAYARPFAIPFPRRNEVLIPVEPRG